MATSIFQLASYLVVLNRLEAAIRRHNARRQRTRLGRTRTTVWTHA